MKEKKGRERPFQSPCIPPRLPCALQREWEGGRMGGGARGKHAAREGGRVCEGE